MEQVLDAVDGDRPGLAGDVDDALDAQQVVAAVGDQGLDPGDEGGPVDRSIAARDVEDPRVLEAMGISSQL